MEPRLETPRLVLRPPLAGDEGLMLNYYQENRDHLGPWEPARDDAFYTLGHWENQIEIVRREIREGRGLRLALFSKETAYGPIIGQCNFSNVIRGVFQACLLGYSLDHRFEGRGIMFEALDAAIGYVFREMKLHRVMANYIPRNLRSGRLLERLGFEKEGHARDYLKINGRWEDHVLAARINSDL